MRDVQVTLHEDLVATVDRVAKKLGTSRSAFTRQALRDIRSGERLEAGKLHALFQTRILPMVEARNHYDVTRDGQRFIVNSRRPEDAALPITVVVGWAPEAKK